MTPKHLPSDGNEPAILRDLRAVLGNLPEQEQARLRGDLRRLLDRWRPLANPDAPSTEPPA